MTPLSEKAKEIMELISTAYEYSFTFQIGFEKGYHVRDTELQAELTRLKKENEEAKKAIEIVQTLPDWSWKYPRGKIYPMSQKSMDDELVKIEEQAKEFIINKETAPATVTG
jgi:hypothetical protein